MSKSLGRILVGVVCAALFHAAFSTYEYLSTQKALSRPSSSLPTSIVAEALLALIIFLPGTALSMAPLKDVTYRGELSKRSIDDTDSRLGFMRLSARSRALFGDQPVLKTTQ